jgi:hypothetical protein
LYRNPNNERLFIFCTIAIIALYVAFSFLSLYLFKFDSSIRAFEVGHASAPPGEKLWADQEVYKKSAEHLANFKLPTRWHLVFSVGYPMLGALFYHITPNAPFLIPSFLLAFFSFTFSFLAVKRLLGYISSIFFISLILFIDFHARTFNYTMEVFLVPWSNQVLVFYFALIFYIFAYDWKPNLVNCVIIGACSGLTLAAREESLFFIIPIAFYWLWNSDYKTNTKWIVVFSLSMFLLYAPQLILKLLVIGDITQSGKHELHGLPQGSYLDVLFAYFGNNNLYNNLMTVIISSTDVKEAERIALFQGAPWLWLSPFGIIIALFSKEVKNNIKVFLFVSVGLSVFYLSGPYMHVMKLKIHCLRFITPSFFALHFGSVYAIASITRKLRLT